MALLYVLRRIPTCDIFLIPLIEWFDSYCYCLALFVSVFVCCQLKHSLYTFWNAGYNDFIFDMHTQVMTLTIVLKIDILDFAAAGGLVFHTHMWFF